MSERLLIEKSMAVASDDVVDMGASSVPPWVLNCSVTSRFFMPRQKTLLCVAETCPASMRRSFLIALVRCSARSASGCATPFRTRSRSRSGSLMCMNTGSVYRRSTTTSHSVRSASSALGCFTKSPSR